MLLKKQTVWLLTMLSLVVVLSIYYITSPEKKSNTIASVEQKTNNQVNQKQGNNKTDATNGKTVVSQVSGDDEFEALRLKLEEQRSELKADLTSVVASTDLSPEERSKARDQMQKLTETAQKEEILETLIRSMGYEDALVRADGSKVLVTVKSKKTPSRSEANQIIQKVKSEIGETNYVAVEFSPSK
jgi:stage III sporulation protein AH